MYDLDMLFDYYTCVNLAAGGYATVSSRIKNNDLEKAFRKLAGDALQESKAAAEMVLKFGGKVLY
ncbi:MAG: hypothetical protein AB1500_02875 [Bacillota bacterium]